MLQMSLLGLEHGMTVTGMRTVEGRAHLVCLRRRGDSFRGRPTSEGTGRLGVGREWLEAGAEAKVEGGTWPRLLHASSGHQPGRLQYCNWSPSPAASSFQTLSQMGRQTPFPCPLPSSISLENKRRRRQNKKPEIKKTNTPQSRTQGRWRKERKKLQRSPGKSPTTGAWGWEVEPQSGVGGEASGAGLPGAIWPSTSASGPQGKCSQEGESSLGPPSWTGSSQVYFSWDIPHTHSAETKNQ